MNADIDAAINTFDPDAVRRTHYNASQRDIKFGKPDDQTGARSIYGSMSTADADWLERRIDALVATVCAEDPRRMGERRADAMRVACTGAETLPCRCNRPECPQNVTGATDGNGVVDRTRAGSVVIHVLADQAAIDAAIREAATQPSIGTPWLDAHKPTEVYFPQSDWVQMYTFLDMETILEQTLVVHDHWNPPQGPVTAAAAARGEQRMPVRRDFGSRLLNSKRRTRPRTSLCRPSDTAGRDTFDPPDAIAPADPPHPTPPPQSKRPPRQWPPPRDPAPTGNAVILGSGHLSTPELAELVRTGATITALRPIGAAPEPRHRPSDRLSWFIRARDLTCSFPGCDRPAEQCDLDHVDP
ncbi:HNH endonuclease signature motif containing protein [Mycolicibacterium brumae]|uniref:HNH endonuclease signature motif containing protein n=1 Tax=Mycolicibacterium brumae TaxID=85968 RepID=UPI0021AE40FE|nr:HNH endonuclease signature motif containing protein [Mycolicibacterium brumae]UWW08483.1 HNH endonuclease [Mycolicibacterium brumae]